MTALVIASARQSNPLGRSSRSAVASFRGPGRLPASSARVDAPPDDMTMRAHPTDPALPSFYLGTTVHEPTMIIDGSTVHVVLASDDQCLPAVMAAPQIPSSSRNYLLVDIDEDMGASVALHWHREHTDVNGHRHVLHLTTSIENVRAEYSGHSENSIGQCIEHELAGGELARFGLTAGSLLFSGTRTVQVWHAQPATCGAVTPVTRVFLQTGVHFYLWMHSPEDDAGALFPELDGDSSAEAG